VSAYSVLAGYPNGVDDFSIVFLPDTQIYCRDGTAYFSEQTTWIAAQQAALNIQAVVHLGDVVDSTLPAQWPVATTATDILQAANVPNYICVGNHDYDAGIIYDSDQFNANYPTTRYTGSGWWTGGFYEAGKTDNFWATLSIGGATWLFLILEYQPRSATLAWAAGILAANPNATVIVATHEAINVSAAWAQATLWDAVRQRANVLMVASAHYPDADAHWRWDTADDCHVLHSWMADYQAEANGGDGYLQILKIRPSTRQMTMQTYSPSLDNELADATHQWSMAY
jgi:hypothetical protein